MAYTQSPELFYDHSAVSVREDVIDQVAIMSPVTAPLTYELGFGPALGQPDFDCLVDQITSPVTTLTTSGSGAYGGDVARRSAYPSGWEAQFPSADARTRLANTTCIVERTTDVSGTLRVILHWGTGDEYAYKIDKMFLEVVEQYDYNCHFGQFSAGSGGTSAETARMTHGVIPWIMYTGWKASATTNPSGNATIAGFAIPRSGPTDRTGFSGTWFHNTTGTALTRALFHSEMLRPAYQRGMQIDGTRAFCGAAVKDQISSFALVYSSGTTPAFNLNDPNVDAEDRYINEGIDVFQTNYGKIYFSLDRHLDGSETHTLSTGTSGESQVLDVDESMFILEKRFWRHRVLRGIGYTPLAKVGDADKALIVLEAGLQCLNPIAGIAGNNLVSGS